MILSEMDWDVSLATGYEISNYLISAVYGGLSA